MPVEVPTGCNELAQRFGGRTAVTDNVVRPVPMVRNDERLPSLPRRLVVCAQTGLKREARQHSLPLHRDIRHARTRVKIKVTGIVVVECDRQSAQGDPSRRAGVVQGDPRRMARQPLQEVIPPRTVSRRVHTHGKDDASNSRSATAIKPPSH